MPYAEPHAIASCPETGDELADQPVTVFHLRPPPLWSGLAAHLRGPSAPGFPLGPASDEDYSQLGFTDEELNEGDVPLVFVHDDGTMVEVELEAFAHPTSREIREERAKWLRQSSSPAMSVPFGVSKAFSENPAPPSPSVMPAASAEKPEKAPIPGER